MKDFIQAPCSKVRSLEAKLGRENCETQFIQSWGKVTKGDRFREQNSKSCFFLIINAREGSMRSEWHRGSLPCFNHCVILSGCPCLHDVEDFWIPASEKRCRNARENAEIWNSHLQTAPICLGQMVKSFMCSYQVKEHWSRREARKKRELRSGSTQWKKKASQK